MNKGLIVSASDSDRRLMSSLLTRAGYEPISAENMEAAKDEAAKLLKPDFFSFICRLFTVLEYLNLTTITVQRQTASKEKSR